MKYTQAVAVALLFTSQIGIGQNALIDKLYGVERLEEIMQIVDNHYEEISSGVRDSENERPYKHWARWAQYMSSRTDSSGRIVDVEARVRKARKSYQSANRSSAGNWSFAGPSSINSTNGSAIGIGRVDRIAFHPTNASIFYIGCPSAGLLRTTNGGASYTVLTDKLPSTAISGIVVDHSNPNRLFVLTGDGDTNISNYFVFLAGYHRSSAGVFVSYDAGINWYPTAPLPTGGAYSGYNMAQDPNNPNVILAATSAGLYRTDNGGGSWTEVLSGVTYEVKYRPGDSQIVYATQRGRFYRSTDFGVTWSLITAFNFSLPSHRVAMAVTPHQNNRVYLLSGSGSNTTFGGLFISTDNGASFTRQINTPNIVEQRCDGTGGRNQSFYDLALAVDPFDAGNIVAAGITTWASSTTGLTWSNVSAGRCTGFTTSTGFMHADVHDIEYNPLNGFVYVCNDGGVVRSSNLGQSWVDLSNGIAASQIYHMAGTPSNTNNMIIGLQDNGIKRRGSNTTIWDHSSGADGFDCVYKVGSSTEGFLSANADIIRFTNNGASYAGGVTSPSDNFFPRVQVHNTISNLVLAGYDDIYRSTDNGATWTNEGVSGNWDIERCPSNNARFYAAGGNSSFATSGNMYRSDDDGLTWTALGSNPGFPTAGQRITDIEVNPNGSNNVYITLGGFSEGQKVFRTFSSGGSWSNYSGSLPNVPINAIQLDNNGNAYLGTDIGVFYRGAAMSDWVPFWNNLPNVPVTDIEIYPNSNLIRVSTFGRGVWQSDLYSSCNQWWSLSGNVSGNRYYEAWNYITSTATVFGAANTKVIYKAANYIDLKEGFQVGVGNNFRAYLKPCGEADEEY